MSYLPTSLELQKALLLRPVFATTATAAGTTTLTVASASTQEFTGSTTQTVTMPVVTTLVEGWATTFINKSTGAVTLKSSGANNILVLPAGKTVTLVCRSIATDTTAAAWDKSSPVILKGSASLLSHPITTTSGYAIITIPVIGAEAGDVATVNHPLPGDQGAATVISIESGTDQVVVVMAIIADSDQIFADVVWTAGQIITAQILK